MGNKKLTKNNSSEIAANPLRLLWSKMSKVLVDQCHTSNGAKWSG